MRLSEKETPEARQWLANPSYLNACRSNFSQKRMGKEAMKRRWVATWRVSHVGSHSWGKRSLCVSWNDQCHLRRWLQGFSTLHVTAGSCLRWSVTTADTQKELPLRSLALSIPPCPFWGEQQKRSPKFRGLEWSLKNKRSPQIRRRDPFTEKGACLLWEKRSSDTRTELRTF